MTGEIVVRELKRFSHRCEKGRPADLHELSPKWARYAERAAYGSELGAAETIEVWAGQYALSGNDENEREMCRAEMTRRRRLDEDV